MQEAKNKSNQHFFNTYRPVHVLVRVVLLSQLPVGLHRLMLILRHARTISEVFRRENREVKSVFRVPTKRRKKWTESLRDLRLTGITSNTQDFIVVGRFQVGSLRFSG